MAAAAIVGYEVGTSGAETNRFVSDLKEMSKVGGRITEARNAAAQTVTSHIEMYKSIERDVQELDLILKRLRTGVDIYNRKYPAQRENMSQTVQSIEIGMKRMDLLRRQIAVAKDIEHLDSASQWSAWETRMQPLLDQEGALDSAK